MPSTETSLWPGRSRMDDEVVLGRVGRRATCERRSGCPSRAALGATAVALLLGTLAALAVSAHRFFGREVVSFARDPSYRATGDHHRPRTAGHDPRRPEPLGISFGLTTIVIGHATFCVVVVYNNAVARMRRTVGSLDEASADLGADSWQTFRYVLLPQLRTALLAGALLAFALSFDEVVVTTFTSGVQETLPIWIFGDLTRPAELPDRERRRPLRHRRFDHPCVHRVTACRKQRADVGSTSSGRRRRGNAGPVGQLGEATPMPTGHETPVPPMPQYPFGFAARYCWWYGSA